MAHGIIHGAKHLILHGVRHNALPLGSIPGVTQDSGSQKYVPANGTEWNALFAAGGISNSPPSQLYLCQESSGNLADSIGIVALTVAGSPSYQVAQTGWQRKAVSITATTVQQFASAAGSGPNPSVISVAWLLYVGTPNTPGGNRNIITGTSDATGFRVDHTAANKLMLACGANTATSVGSYTLSTVYPALVVYNRTASSITLYTDQEILTCTFASVNDGNHGIGAVQGNGDAGSKYLYMAEWGGVNAEFDTTKARKTLQTLGWTIPW